MGSRGGEESLVAQILAIALKIVVVAFVFSVLIFVHEFGHFLLAKKKGVRVEKFSLGFGKKLIGFKRGDTEYIICAFPLGGYVKMAGEDPREKLSGKPWEYLSQPISRRLAIVVAGPISNYLLAFLIFMVVLFVWGAPSKNPQIGGLIEDFPAQVHGLKEGDWIMAIDGESVETWKQMAEIIHKKYEGSIVLRVRRDGRELLMTIMPKAEVATDVTGKETRIGLIGITPVMRKYAPLTTLASAGEKTLTLTVITYKGIWWLISGRMAFREAVAGPIGIASIIGEAASLGIVPILQLTGILGIALAIFNLLPFPILDGGNVLFLTLEKVRGRPLSPKVQESIQQVALIFIIILVLFVSYNDIMRMTQ